MQWHENDESRVLACMFRHAAEWRWRPNGAATRPVTTPAAIFKYASFDQYPTISAIASRSKSTAGEG